MSAFLSATVEPSRTRALRVPSAIELRPGWRAFDELRDDWQQLVTRVEGPTPGASWEACAALRAGGGVAGTPVFVLVSVDGRPAILLPLEERAAALGGRRLRLLGQGVHDRIEPPLTLDGLLVEPALVLREVARRLGRGVLFDLAGLPPEARVTRWLDEGLDGAAGWRRLAGVPETSVRLNGGWLSVEASLGRALREAAQRGMERAALEGRTEVDVRPPRRPAEAREVLEAAGARDDGGSGAGAVLARFVEHCASGSSLRVARIAREGELLAASLVWLAGGSAAELVAVEAPEGPAVHAREQLLVALLRYLVDVDGAARFLPRPGESVGASLPPRPQARFVGAPFPGSARLVANTLAWLVGGGIPAARTLRAAVGDDQDRGGGW
jgi:hypothetical protein